MPGIYAIGDVIAGPMLAHKAEDEGVALAEIAGRQGRACELRGIPGVVYTWPEVAGVGRTEEQLKAAGIDYRGRQISLHRQWPRPCDGQHRRVREDPRRPATDRILGCHILGPDAGTLIAEIVTAMEFGASSEDVARICHAHPSLNEAVKEAALAVDGRALHI